MHATELLVAGLLVVVIALSALARRLELPYPIVLVLGGAAIGFVPGLPRIDVDPDAVLVVFLPPLLYGASIYANYGDFRANRRWLALNTVPLVLVTMAVVAVVAHLLVPGMPWAAAFVLGAVVSPTDAIAPGTVMRRLDAPRRLVSAVEGEGLFNDATALVAYRVAVGAAVAGTFSVGDAGLKFVLGAAGGVAVGLAVGWLAALVRARIEDAQISVLTSLLTGYLAYIPAEALGASGVLAAVTAGIVVGIRAPARLSARSRLQGYFVWDLVDFALNAALFLLIGLELRDAVRGLTGSNALTLGGYAVAVAGAVVVTRLLWFAGVPYAVWAVDRKDAPDDHAADLRERLVAAWCGMRGAVSLAVALALPLETDAGGAFPQRDLIVFLTFAVIFVTLVAQGLTLPALIRRLRVDEDDDESREEVHARLCATKAALERIDELAAEDWTRDETVERMRAMYEFRKARFAARAGKVEDRGYEDRSAAYQEMVRTVLAAQRHALVQLRDDGDLSNEAMHRILTDLDLEESRLED
jgi:monovalent cation/hydrogen antiporter